MMDWLEIQGRIQDALINVEALNVSESHRHMKAEAVKDLKIALRGVKAETGVDRVERSEP